MEGIQTWWEGIQQQFYINFIQDDRWKYLWNGRGVTLQLTFCAVLIGIVLGVILAMIRSTYDKNYQEMRPGFGRFMLKILNVIAKIYLTVIRGTPVVVQLMIMYYIILASSNNKLLVGMIAFGVNSGAYVAEIVRSGIMSIDPGRTQLGLQLCADHALCHHSAGSEKRIASTGKRIHCIAEGNLCCRLHRNAGPDKRRRHYPRRYIQPLYAFDWRRVDLSGYGYVLYLPGK